MNFCLDSCSILTWEGNDIVNRVFGYGGYVFTPSIVIKLPFVVV